MNHVLITWPGKPGASLNVCEELQTTRNAPLCNSEKRACKASDPVSHFRTYKAWAGSAVRPRSTGPYWGHVKEAKGAKRSKQAKHSDRATEPEERDNGRLIRLMGLQDPAPGVERMEALRDWARAQHIARARKRAARSP